MGSVTDTTQVPSVEDVLKINDPGEVDRHLHGPIDRFVINVGNVLAWAFPLLMVAIVAQVILRANGMNQAWLDDAQWWIYGVAMVTAFGYAITTTSHVRVDILHQNYSPERKARIEVFALGWLLLPFIALMTDVMSHYAWASIESGEGSSSPNGLHRLYILKTTLPFLFLLSGLAAWSSLRRNLSVFSSVNLHKTLIWLFPTAVFITWRIVHYIGYWVVSFTNPDIVARRITREPFFDYALSIALVLVIATIIFSMVRSRNKGVI